MARRKKSGPGGVLAVLFVGVVALLAAIPKEVWIGAGMLGVIGVALYMFGKSKKPDIAVEQSEPPKPAARTSARQSRSPARSIETSASNPTPAAAPAPRSVDDDEPVSVRTSSPVMPNPVSPRSAPAPFVSNFKVPAAPKGIGPGRWIPPGEAVSVAGLTIPGGMVYVGTSLPTPFDDRDPCLIDPTRPVASQGDYTERDMGYWPSYSEVSPHARGAYLNWLAGGRQDPRADIGYVFLFFYGLERRAIIDGAKDEAAQADWPLIAEELRRLLTIYADKSHSFRNYAGALLDWVSLAAHPARLYERPVPEFPRTFELPLYIRLALGQAAVDAAPVPAHLALAWARLDPTISLRTPATRCAEQFEQLFAQKYAEMHGSGMVLPRNRTKLKLVYRAASAGFQGYQELKLTFKDTPDVTVLTGPARKLQDVVEAATKPLESFSRLVGKTPEAKATLEALLLLPSPLWPQEAQQALQTLKGRMGDGMVAMPFKDLLDALGASGTFTKDKTLALARTLESANVGMEPDVLGGTKPPKPDEKVVLFALPPTEQLSRANGPYRAAALTLQLASAVAAADGEFGIKEMSHLRETVMSWSHLTPAHVRRLLAHLRLLMQAPASLTALKKRFEPLDISTKETIAAFMATVAQSDGEVSPAEVKMLEKVYKALGVDSKKVFSDVHAVAAGTKPTAAATAKVEQSGFKLDPARIAALQKDTEKVSALLANIFTETEEPAVAAAAEPVEAETETETAEAPKGLMGLDEAHTALARMMLSRPEWSREELLDVAADLDLMLDGALEHINEAAFDTHDMALFEGDDPVTVNAEILEKVEA
ncbi:MAG: TerB N-terminal domain-containing protein [Burkholderiaceae bacterium]|nr:TerB N-terminal domain-containing protein [Burkholderiaceae bacterium]